MTQRELCAVIAANCRRARRNLKLSQTDLAILAGTSQEQISRFEGGNTAPTLQSLLNLAEALHTTPAALLTPTAAALVTPISGSPSPGKRRSKATASV